MIDQHAALLKVVAIYFRKFIDARGMGFLRAISPKAATKKKEGHSGPPFKRTLEKL
jgi:hypothetical protein